MGKKILVTRSSLPPLEEYVEEIRDIFESHWLTNMGAKHEALTEELRKFFGVRELTLFQNGHLALEFALQALELSGEVITTPFTFASTTWAIVRSGLTPVFCDIDPETYTLDPAKLESLITERTAAILPVHVYGNLCDTEALAEIAARHKLPLIYDAAHAFGVRKNGVSAAAFGDMSMFSFHATKVFHTIEGGAVCCRDKELSTKLFRLKNFGIEENETYCVGGNGKMNEFEAAMGLLNLRHLPEELAKRQRVYTHYVELLSEVEGIKLPKQQAGVTANYAYFPVVFTDTYGETRDEAALRLQAKGYYPRKYFYPCTNAFPFLNGRIDPGHTPIAEDISKRVLTLPLYADLELADVEQICRILRREA